MMIAAWYYMRIATICLCCRPTSSSCCADCTRVEGGRGVQKQTEGCRSRHRGAQGGTEGERETEMAVLVLLLVLLASALRGH